MNDLSSYTRARVRLGIAGDSLPTGPLLALRLAHARARDAVHMPFDSARLRAQMNARNWPSTVLQTSARTRDEYLRRPDLGRQLASASATLLSDLPRPQKVVIVIGDGLSALAVEQHAVPLLDCLFAQFPDIPCENNPLFVVHQARVAIGDAIGELLGADALVLLIGERPGLSSPDSLGVYVTWQPNSHRTDAERNCVSNIHAAGLSYQKAAHKLVFLLGEMYRRKLSGVALKDTSDAQALSLAQGNHDRL